MSQPNVGVRVVSPVRITAFRVIEANVREILDEWGVETAEIGEVVSYDVGNFGLVFCWQCHAGIAHVANACYCTVEFELGKIGREEEGGS